MALIASTALAQAVPPDSPALYAQIAPVNVSGKEALAQLRVPRDVYLASRSARLADLRLFDGNGAPLRFALRAPALPAAPPVSSSPVTMFPVRAAAGGSAATSLDIRTSSDGKLISVNARSAGEVKAGESLSALVLDLGGAAPQPLIALRLQQPKDADNYTARIAVGLSDDLKSWRDAGEAVVSWLHNTDGKTLASDRIELDGTVGSAARYARLTWREGVPLAFAGVTAERRGTGAPALPLESMLITGRPGKVAGDIVYPSALALPVRAVGLQFGEQNVVAPALLGRYVALPAVNGGEARYDVEPLFRATFYRLDQGGKLRASGDFPVDETHVAEWVLRPQAALTPPPSLRIGWQAATIVFLTSGAPPYSLAVGRDKADSAVADIASVAPGLGEAELAQVETATVGPARANAGVAVAAGAAQEAAAAARTRTMILWAVLVLGVLAVGLMARQLMRQMPKDEPAD